MKLIRALQRRLMRRTFFPWCRITCIPCRRLTMYLRGQALLDAIERAESEPR